MDKFKNFLGIDVSKEFFDAVIILNSDKNTAVHEQFTNNSDGLKQMFKWLKSHKAYATDTLICLEHTGVYGTFILEHCASKNFHIWLEVPINIIKSSGLQRGKNDKVDAQRIAIYAMKNHTDAQLYKAPRPVVLEIRKLLSLRESLLEMKTILQVQNKEFSGFNPKLGKELADYSKDSLESMGEDIKNIEDRLSKIIKEDENLNRLFAQITSVPGMGKITAMKMICYTNEFTKYNTPRQLACYCGVVPFDHTSGKSVRGKPRVHFMANKDLKQNLHMCALSSVRSKTGSMPAYYERKVAEGKNKMLVLNNIKNKLIHIVCACVAGNRLYEVRNAV
jgi:transposase